MALCRAHPSLELAQLALPGACELCVVKRGFIVCFHTSNVWDTDVVELKPNRTIITIIDHVGDKEKDTIIRN